MGEQDVTCWTMIQGASRGRANDIETFVDRYGPIVQAYLEARWRRPPLRDHIDDASQETFIECFREGGVLASASAEHIKTFRAFLLGVVRNIARRFEKRVVRDDSRERSPATDFDVPDPEAEDKRLSVVFDRAWAASIVREAAARQAERAEIVGPEAVRRVELLRLHFNEGLAVKDIAKRWDAPLKALHHDLERARAEYADALRDVIHYHYPGERRSAEREVARLLELIG